MKLSMTTEEIKSRYKSMKPTQDRLQILADLNGCEKKTIQAVLDGHEPDKPKMTNSGTMLYQRWTADEELELIEMVKAGKTIKEAADRFARSGTAVKAKAETLGHPFADRKRKTRRTKRENGACVVGRVEDKKDWTKLITISDHGISLTAETLPADIISTSKMPNYAETVKTITDQLNRIITYADKLRQENDRLTQQLAAVRKAVE